MTCTQTYIEIFWKKFPIYVNDYHIHDIYAGKNRARIVHESPYTLSKR